MSYQVVDLKCPGCGAGVKLGQTECEWCHRPIVISMSIPEINKYVSACTKALSENPDNGDLNKSIGMCYLKLKMLDKALSAFDKAIEDNQKSDRNDSEPHFYAAICSLGGKKAFLNLGPTIEKALEYINAALMIEPKGIYYYFMAYIKYDYYHRKLFKTSPTYVECLSMANAAGLSSDEINKLYDLLGVSRPSCL
ncbi:MAG: tetratricopeptide repeat protein [Thermoguttaceae bacterium]|nr:tetratricopeptide repeat protein [Thermoguttaceae bacterium]